jgi:stage II sporulation protein D
MPLESYLTGVLASEMPLTWPLESLKAQAVAARSYALAVMKERSRKVYQVESNILDQVFRPLAVDDEGDPLVRKALQAVRETQGQKLVIGNGRTLKAYFHSDCGGHTVSARSVWGKAVESGEAADASCPSNPRANWELGISKTKIYAGLKKFFSLGRSPLQVVGLEFEKGEDERVHQVRVAFNEGSPRVLSGNEFRALVGFQDLKSTLFEAKMEGETIRFRGRGFGHGVGLCQWGSRALGLQGVKYAEILRHYYPLARLSPR